MAVTLWTNLQNWMLQWTLLVWIYWTQTPARKSQLIKWGTKKINSMWCVHNGQTGHWGIQQVPAAPYCGVLVRGSEPLDLSASRIWTCCWTLFTFAASSDAEPPCPSWLSEGTAYVVTELLGWRAERKKLSLATTALMMESYSANKQTKSNAEVPNNPSGATFFMCASAYKSPETSAL